MGLTVQLLGRPRVTRAGAEAYQFRSRKSWAVLAYLILSRRPPTRSQLAGLLFAEADDPLRALRWSLTEIRRCLADDGVLGDDPVQLHLDHTVVVDIDVLTHGSWADAVELPGLGDDLLDGTTIRGAAAFEAWLLAERRRIAAAAEAILHEAALGSLSRGALDTARGYAVRAVAMSPLDENHQALLIRLYRLAGDNAAAEQQYAACLELFERELGVAPGNAVAAALGEGPYRRPAVTDAVSVAAIIEAGSAAVAAGAVEAGVSSLRTAVRLADGAADGRDGLRVGARLVLAEALIHSLGGLDEEGLAALHEADRIALAADDLDAVARARAELGYVDFLRARYDRAEHWLTDARRLAKRAPSNLAPSGLAPSTLAPSTLAPSTLAKATTYLGAVESDRANYGQAVTLLDEAITLSRAAGEPRREAFGLAMLGRVSLLRRELDAAAGQLTEAIELAQESHWLSFLPWPQALLGEVQLVRGEAAAASETLRQAFARACQIGDPCWEGIAARGLALVAEADGDTGRAFEVLADARARCNRLADPYVWLDVYILDAQCLLGRRHGHPATGRWVAAMGERAARTGMRELTVRSMRHAAALGSAGDAAAAALLAADIENPALAGWAP